MSLCSSSCRRFAAGAACMVMLSAWAPARGWQITEDMVGQSEEAWSLWQTATTALQRDEKAVASAALDTLAGLDLSELRLALMADRTGSLRMEQWSTQDDAPASLKGVLEKITSGRRQKALAEDGWHFAAIGRFNYADANFKALDESNPDPVALLELARQNPNRHLILIKLISNTEVGPAAKRFLEILSEGEERLRMDPYEIAANIAKLGGPPRMSYNATNRLKESGEYSIPHLLQALQDSNRRALHPAIIQVIPQIGRGALNPLCVALGMTDEVTRKIIIDSLARIGYRQAAPYLAKVAEDSASSSEARAAARQAMSALGVSASQGLSQLFMELAEGYYKNIESLRADARRGTANVWYLREGELRLVEVPTAIFNDIMAMRSCEEALSADAASSEAIAYWLAANFRREAKLGLDVESDQPDALAAKDATRPDPYPRSIYFARAAGPKYNHAVLALALADRDPGVALGAIAALAETAGEPSLVGGEAIKQPLVAALSFPSRQVRIKAALALGRALPKTSFAGSENVMPVFVEALAQSEAQGALIVDPDAGSANKFQAILGTAGYRCAVGETLHEALGNGRKANLSSYDVMFLASDMSQPDVMKAVGDLRHDLPTSATPVVVIAKEDGLNLATSVARTYTGVEVLLSDVTELGDPAKISEQVSQRIARATLALGMTPLDRNLSLELALESAEVLRRIAEAEQQVFDFSRAVPGLITALNGGSETLRVKAAHALALAAGAEAQSALGEAALNGERAAAERAAHFGSWAESARYQGNVLGDGELIGRLIEFTMKEQDLVLRAAASRALGALNLPNNQASEIIRSQHNG